MKALILWLIIMFLIVTIVTYPFKLKAKTHINIFKDIGFIVVKVLGIRIVSAKFKITKDGKFKIEKEKNKKKKKNKELSKYYFKCLARRVDVRKVELFFTGAFKDDLFSVCMLAGVIQMFSAQLVGFLKNKYEKVRAYICIDVDYKTNQLETTSDVEISFSLLDVFLSTSCAVFKYLKENRGKKNV